ncbi:LuxR C-terminal-related transcriptional regulator [Gordonia sp. PKS22-38]|uniref:LuxR C-terminal-related transcriptional regulator n=1 Tax=Gordonia prachuapensis TaxID=3115651 RepID=A0ABU7MWK4_9ACTN|nr:LuxR C-terminal-related transcriptional regulator [Gordonia sp. PKS22-38]
MNSTSGRLAPSLRLRASRPVLPPGYVHLSRVGAALDRCPPGGVAVVSAGAGYGKTLAVAGWAGAHRPAGATAWLTVDDADGLRAFWNDVLGALAAADALSEPSGLRDIAPASGFAEPEVDRIIDGLADSPTPITLVLDDVHRIAAPEVLSSIRRLIRRQPPTLRLIVITRTATALRLQKLRLDGRLTEITTDELQFTRDDVAEFCDRAGVDLPDDDIDALLDRTQGWPTGLRLAVLSGRGTSGDVTHRVTGQNELVAAYLLEEVLEELAPSDRRFLLATSIVDTVSAPLARALAGRADSRRVLDDLVANNVLTVRLSDRPDWYAYHPLFRELLMDRLDAENPDAAAELHRRAADWFAANDDPVAAVRHYGRARDWPAMTELLGSVAAPLVLSTQASALAAALEPAAVEAEARPTTDTLVAAAILCYHRGDFVAMDRNAEDAARVLGADEPSTIGSRILIALIRMVTARTSRLSDVVDRCDDILTLVSQAPRTAIPAAPAYAIMARNNRAIGLFHSGEIDTAARELVVSRAGAEEVGVSLVAMAADTYLALTDLVRGDLPEAAVRTAAIGVLAERRGWARQPQTLALYAARALMYLECNDLEAADRAVDMGRRAVAHGSDTAAWLIIEAAAVGIAVVRGDVFAARTEFRRLDAARRSSTTLPGLLAGLYDAMAAEVQVVSGDAEAVIAVGSDRALPAPYATALNRIVLAKAHLAANNPADAIEALGITAGFAPYRLQATEAEVLAAVASARLHRDSAALEHLASAVRLAAPVGQIRPFVVAGPVVGVLLTRLLRVTDGDQAFVRDLLAACGGEQPGVAATPLLPIESLTDRELMVLRYLPTMYKAAEIAADLFVSVNTVKTHQQSIYRKLGVTTRRDAVDRARERHLI